MDDGWMGDGLMDGRWWMDGWMGRWGTELPGWRQKFSEETPADTDGSCQRDEGGAPREQRTFDCANCCWEPVRCAKRPLVRATRRLLVIQAVTFLILCVSPCWLGSLCFVFPGI